MPPDMNVDHYLSDLRMGFACDMGTAQYAVTGVGETLTFPDPEALKRIGEMLRIVEDGKYVPVTDGPDLAELEQTYRV